MKGRWSLMIQLGPVHLLQVFTLRAFRAHVRGRLPAFGVHSRKSYVGVRHLRTLLSGEELRSILESTRKGGERGTLGVLRSLRRVHSVHAGVERAHRRRGLHIGTAHLHELGNILT